MTYTINPHLPKVRMQAVRLVRSGQSIRQAARYIGVQPSTVSRWVQRAPETSAQQTIPTRSSRPHSHPNQLSLEVINIIIQYRLKYRGCAEVIQFLLKRDGVVVSLSSVKRVLKRNGLIQRNPYKRWHQSIPRPKALIPGTLVLN